MKRSITATMVMAVMMFMASVNGMAQGRGSRGGMSGGQGGQHSAMQSNHGGGYQSRGGYHDGGMRGGYHDGGMRGGYHEGGMRGGYRGGMDRGYVRGGYVHDRYIHHGMERYCDRGGWYPGYVGRVRYVDGRWGYWRDNAWYYYDCFYEPDYYYAQPIHVFRPHIWRGDRVAAGVVGGAIAGAIIGSLIR